MDGNKNLKMMEDLMNWLKSRKNIYNLLIVFLVGVLLVIVTNFFKTTSTIGAEPASADAKQNGQYTQNEMSSYEQAKKNELKYILSQIDGVGRVEVMINFGSGEEQVPAINITNNTSSTKEKDNQGGERTTTQNSNGSTIVTTSKGGSTEPFILKKVNPKITGVLVVAEGAEDSKVKANIMTAVKKVFELTADKVEVYSMKK